MSTMRAKVTFLAEDIWEMPDNGKLHEVIDGDLYVSAAPSILHQFVLGILYRRVAGHVEDEQLGLVLMAPTGLVLNTHNGLEPDIIFVSNARREILTERAVEGAPDLVVEVLSPSTVSKDRNVKMRRYAAAGIPHYWIVDPYMPSIEAYGLSEHGYGTPTVSGPGEMFAPTRFPGLTIAIDSLLQGYA